MGSRTVSRVVSLKRRWHGWANDNDNRHRGWCSPVWEGQHFPETWVVRTRIKPSPLLFHQRARRSFPIRGSTKGERFLCRARSASIKANRKSSSTRPHRSARSKSGGSSCCTLRCRTRIRPSHFECIAAIRPHHRGRRTAIYMIRSRNHTRPGSRIYTRPKPSPLTSQTEPLAI